MKSFIFLSTLTMLLFSSCKKEFRQTNVLIQPLGTIESEYVKLSARAISDEYGCKVYIGKPVAIPQKFRSAKGANRFRADSIISWMKNDFPDSLDYIIGVTGSDISTTKWAEYKETRNEKYLDWGVFGLGFMPGRSCIVSTYRLMIKLKDQQQLRDRIRKVVLHEFGHNRGLEHCENAHCVMSSAAEKISNLDISSDTLCGKCRKDI